MAARTGTLDATYSVVSAEPCYVLGIKGTWRGAADAYLQLFDRKALADAAEGATPKWSQKVYADSPFVYDFERWILFARGCVALFSSTAATKTIVTGAGNVGDFFTEGSSFVVPAVTTEAEVANNAELDIAGGGRLMRLEVNTVAADLNYYLMVFSAAPTNGDTPLWAGPVPDGSDPIFDFGYDGIVLPKIYVRLSLPVSGTSFGAGGAAATLLVTTDPPTLMRATYIAA